VTRPESIRARDRMTRPVVTIHSDALVVMTWGAVTVSPAASIRDAARLMHERKVGELPVGGDRIVGMLPERDVLATFREILDEDVVARPYRWALAYR
jgi:CBS domain-containing protein